MATDFVVTSTGVTLACEDEGEGEPLLFVHGFPLDRSMWKYQIESLSSSYRVIAPDLRGFGESSETDGQRVTMAQFADDLAALLAAKGLKTPVTFVGLSMGGYIAWEFLPEACTTRCPPYPVRHTRRSRLAPSGARTGMDGRRRVADKGRIKPCKVWSIS